MALEGKIAVVTGASRGLGQRVAVTLAEHGARVALVGRNEAHLNETAQMIASRAKQVSGGRGYAVPADMSDPTAPDRIKAAVEKNFGKPSILINAAGVFGPIQLIKDSDPTAWIETLQINMIGPYLLCRAFVNGMIEAGWGRIVNFTSAASLHPPGALNSAYATSKVAINQFTRHLAVELEGTGVTANVIHPGDVKTDMWAYIRDIVEAIPGKDGDAYRQWAHWVEQTGGDDPQKAADSVLNLMSDQAASVTGQFLWIKDPLQAPIPSWGEPTSTQPWRE
jgi:NAD(P)-dependent dehydrogenase (short-subunit alcohol dehydrogenase family)